MIESRVSQALPAWLTYRELTGSTHGAAITTTLLFTQPEFLFVILRSSHEKFTRALMLLCFFWLIHSFRVRRRPGAFAMHVGLFYLTMFTSISSNNLLAHSFIFAVVLALALAWWLESRNPQSYPQERLLIARFVSITLISLGLVYVFTFWLYLPAQSDLRVLKTLSDRLAALFLDVQRQSTNPYTQVASGWINLPVYFLISIGNWLLLGTSFAIWLRQSWLWVFRRQPPITPAGRLTYLFYTAFMAQGALSIFADASGALGGNLQHRLFPSMSMLAAALVGATLARWRPVRFALPLRAGMAAAVFCVAILSVIKATNEPLLSSKWTFYRPAELIALEWSNAYLQNENIWTEFDERLVTAWLTNPPQSSQANTFRGFQVGLDTRTLLVSDVTRMRSARLGRPLPIPPDALQVYDNGEAELYHLRPLTPYQR